MGRLPATSGQKFHWVNKIVVSPNDGQHIYAATRKGVFRSLNGGASWERSLGSKVKGGCLDLAIRTDRATDDLLEALFPIEPEGEE